MDTPTHLLLYSGPAVHSEEIWDEAEHGEAEEKQFVGAGEAQEEQSGVSGGDIQQKPMQHFMLVSIVDVITESAAISEKIIGQDVDGEVDREVDRGMW